MESLSYALIGQRLKSARSAAGFTQRQVAEYLGLSREMISYFETGSRGIDMVRLAKLADLYGRRLTTFLSREVKSENVAVAVKFRAGDLAEDDLEVVAWARKFALNLHKLDRLILEEQQK